jgi:hypothetical protein
LPSIGDAIDVFPGDGPRILSPKEDPNFPAK